MQWKKNNDTNARKLLRSLSRKKGKGDFYKLS